MKEIVTRFRRKAESCGICYNLIEIQGKLSSCTHLFCHKCIKRWSRTENTCPLCRGRFDWIERVPRRREYSFTAKKSPGRLLVNYISQQKDFNPNFESVLRHIMEHPMPERIRFILMRLCALRRDNIMIDQIISVIRGSI